MITITSKHNKEILNFFQSTTIFGITFFLITIILTALVIIPKTTEIFESLHSKDIEINLQLEAELFTKFVNSKKSTLLDLAAFPSVTNAAMLSDGSSSTLIDLFENFSIHGSSGRLLLQDIAGNVIIQSTNELYGAYNPQSVWLKQLLDGVIPYYFRLLSQQGDTFNFQLSIPITYNNLIEGILSAEITGTLQQIFIAQSYGHVAFKLAQDHMTIQTKSSHIKMPRENSLELKHPKLTFTYITDDSVILEKERTLRNTVFLVLLAGLGISFLLFTVLGYRSLNSQHNAGSAKKTFSLTYAIPLVVATIGIAASVTAFLMISNRQQSVIESDQLAKGKQQTQNLREEIAKSLHVLDSLNAFFDASGVVDQHSFKKFATPFLADHPYIKSLKWLPNVPFNERTTHEADIKLAGLTGYGISELDQNGKLVSADARDHYFPIRYTEPMKDNNGSIGIDLSSDGRQLTALKQASISGNIVATSGPLPMQEHTPQSTLLVFNPVYQHLFSHAPIGYDPFAKVKGFTLLVLQLDELLQRTLTNNSEFLSTHIQDYSLPAHPTTLYGDDLAQSGFSFNETINIAGQTWRISTVVRSPDNPGRWLSWLTLLGGVLLTALVTGGLIHLINRREIVEQLVKQRTSELRLLSSIVANSNDSFMITDARNPDPVTGQRKIVYVNTAFTHLTGYDHDEIIGKTPDILHGDKTDKALVKTLTDSITTGASFRGDFIYYKKSSKSYWVDVHIAPITNEIGEITHYGAVQRDITDYKLAQAEKEILINKLINSNEELARFAFVCSHDLQEPLRMIRSFTEKLQLHIADDIANDEKGKKYLHFITDGAERAQILISDILAYSSISTSTQPLESVDCIALIEDIKQLMGTALESNNGKITHDALPMLQGNKTQLYQLFQNLINNAVKYQTAETAPRVHVGVTDAGKLWQFSIEDNGIGMEQRHLSKIFDMFQRLHRRNQYAGTGVGLSICKKVVELHGGTLWVESTPGTGSIFYFTLQKPTSTHKETINGGQPKVG